MNTHTADCTTNDSLRETQEGILGKMILISRFAIGLLAAALAAVSLWALLPMG